MRLSKSLAPYLYCQPLNPFLSPCLAHSFPTVIHPELGLMAIMHHRALRIIHCKVCFYGKASSVSGRPLLIEDKPEVKDKQSEAWREFPEESSSAHELFVQSCTPKFLAAGGQFPLPRQRSVFDTPPPSPPPKDP